MIIRTIDRLPRALKQLVVITYDMSVMAFAFFAAYWIRLGWDASQFSSDQIGLLAVTLSLTFLSLNLLGVYRAVLRYVSLKTAVVTFIGLTSAALMFYLFSHWFNIFVPRSVPVLFWGIAGFFIGVPRIVVRIAVMQQWASGKENVVIYGAGSAGRQLITALMNGREFNPVAIIDEKTSYYKLTVLGLKVYPLAELNKLRKKHGKLKVLIAIEDTGHERKKELLTHLEPYALELLQIPSMRDIVSGHKQIDDLQEVNVEDLLGRAPVTPLDGLLEANITDKMVMVTGAGGSIGSELCRQILDQKPKGLVLFELSEFGLYQIEHELRTKLKSMDLQIEIVPLMGSVQDGQLVRRIIRQFEIQTIYHAAAYKHVPMVEHNVIAGIRNNVFGTAEVAKAAIEEEVETFVLISTDKAVRPTNVMGATKRLAELILQAFSEESKVTRFVMVRFGNVLGSSGSVVPLFKKQIRAGGPITVTHPDIIRYFMTIPEAVQLVIQAGTMGNGGDVYVLDMGEPVKIVDLAKKMTHLMGHKIRDKQNPDGDIEIQYSGLRPGEKLYEELLIGDDVKRTRHERIMAANETRMPLYEVYMLLDHLNFAMANLNMQEIRQILVNAPLSYTPDKQITDSLWRSKRQDVEYLEDVVHPAEAKISSVAS